MKNRTSNNKVSHVEPNEYFVFGSNLSGLHRGGAAAAAMTMGAEYGNPEGAQGNTYAIPTMGRNAEHTLTVKEIKPFVDTFIAYAAKRQEYTFIVTEIGCGIAGLSYKEVAPLFRAAYHIPNIHLPENFWKVLIVDHMEGLIKTYELLERYNNRNWFQKLLSL